MTSLENESTSLSESIHTSNEKEEESLSADSTKSLENDPIHNDTIYDPKTSAIVAVPKLILVMAENETPLECIPLGSKENVYFAIKNDSYMENRNKKQRSYFPDDCGVWNSASGSTPKSTYLILPNGELKKMFRKMASSVMKKVKG